MEVPAARLWHKPGHIFIVMIIRVVIVVNEIYVITNITVIVVIIVVTQNGFIAKGTSRPQTKMFIRFIALVQIVSLTY